VSENLANSLPQYLFRWTEEMKTLEQSDLWAKAKTFKPPVCEERKLSNPLQHSVSNC